MKTAKKASNTTASNVYDLQSIRAPRLAGRALRTFTALLEEPTGRRIGPGHVKPDYPLCRICQFHRITGDQFPSRLYCQRSAGWRSGDGTSLERKLTVPAGIGGRTICRAAKTAGLLLNIGY